MPLQHSHAAKTLRPLETGVVSKGRADEGLADDFRLRGGPCLQLHAVMASARSVRQLGKNHACTSGLRSLSLAPSLLDTYKP